jgi:hypothetical protein
MTVAHWQKKTSSVLADRKNPLITDLDILIGQYHTAGKTDVQKLKLLILIRRYCNDWLSEKGDKGKSFRREYVAELRDQTTALLQSPAMQAAVQQRRAGGNQAKPGKQLHENIAEVLQPRANAKQKYGLQADMQMTRVSAGNLENRIDNANMNRAANEQLDPHDLISALDFVGELNQKKTVLRNLAYLQKADRLKCRLQLWPDGRFHRGGQDTPHASPGGRELYAMDDMEFLYTSAQPAQAGRFHHSSFLSGKPVLCAGEITVQNGIITHIDNLSGHYRPATQQLLDCVRVLARKYQVDLRSCVIMDQAQQNAQWRNAAHFVMLNGRPPVQMTRRA